MQLGADSALQQVSGAVADAQRRLKTGVFQWLAWPQTWPNSGCGRAGGGVVMQAFWDAQTVIASGDDDAVLVYHQGIYAYTVERPNDSFWELCGQRRLPGANDEAGRMAMELA